MEQYCVTAGTERGRGTKTLFVEVSVDKIMDREDSTSDHVANLPSIQDAGYSTARLCPASGPR
jgi:hypothetical protein